MMMMTTTTIECMHAYYYYETTTLPSTPAPIELYAKPGTVFQIGNGATGANFYAGISPSTTPAGQMNLYGSGSFAISGLANVLPTVINQYGNWSLALLAPGACRPLPR